MPAFLLAFLLSAPATGDDLELPARMSLQEAVEAPAGEGDDGAWRIDLALYLWLPSLDGEVSTGGGTAEVDVPASEALEALKAGISLHGEAWHRNRVGVLADVWWMGFEVEPSGSSGGELRQELAFAEGLAGMRFGSRDVSLDVLMGLRWVYSSSEVELPGGGGNHRSHSYLDPVLGARLLMEARDWLAFSLRVDVGGFGVGTEMSGQFIALVHFRCSDHITLSGGWRSLGLELEDDGYETDLRLSGPLLSFAIGF